MATLMKAFTRVVQTMRVRAMACLELAFYATWLIGGGLMIAWYVEGEPRDTLVRRIETMEVEPGGELRILVRDRISQNCLVTINRWIIDSSKVVFPLEAQTDTRRTGIHERVIANTVPIAAVPGPAIYRVLLAWKCNPLQRLWPRSSQLPDLHFTIIESRKESKLWVH